MISRRAIENLVAAIILMLFAAALYLSFDYGPRARMVPVPIAALGIFLVIVQLIWQNLRSPDELQIDTVDLFAGRPSPRAADAGTKAPAGSGDDESSTSGGLLHRWLRSEIAPFALVGLFLCMIYVFSPIVAVYVFVTGYLYLSRHCAFLIALIYSTVCLFIVYVMFGIILEVNLNRGLAMPFINQFVRF